MLPGESVHPFGLDQVGPLLAPGPVSWLIRYEPSTDSTQDLARAAATAGAAEGWTVVTDWQHQGRGRLGRQWVATAGRDLLFSAILRPPGPWLSLLPLLAGLALCGLYLRRRRFVEPLLLGGTAYASLISVRHSTVFVVLASPLIAAELAGSCA